MKQLSVLFLCCVSLALVRSVDAQTKKELRIGDGSGFLGESIGVNLYMTSDSQVQGFVMAADWDASKLKGESITNGAVLASADVVVPRLADGHMVLGVVMDSDGADGELIPVGTDIVLGVLTVKALAPAGAADEVATINIADADGKYNTVDLGPLLDNIIVIGGLSVGKGEGLVRTNGRVTLKAPPPGEFVVQNTSGFFGSCVKVPIVLRNLNPVQGFVVSLQHDAGVSLSGIAAGSAATAADFIQQEVFPALRGGTLGVVMELDGIPPFNTIAPGANNVIALYEFCTGAVSAADCDKPPQTFGLRFVDSVLGDPLKENVIVVGGLSKGPKLTNGTLTLSIDRTKPPCQVVPPDLGLAFAVGSCELVDDPNSADKDRHIPGSISVSRGTVARPTTFGVGLYYLASEDDEPDEAQQTDHIQGVSMAICFDPNCILCDETYSLAGTITEAVGAEFVNVHCENDLTDGDPGELIVGILVDALPPFDGQDLPPTSDYLRLICVDFHVNPQSSCENCKTTQIRFCNGADGRGSVPIRNLVSIMNQSFSPALNDGTGAVTISNEPVFVRGDCNGSNAPDAVDIADAAAVISYLFLTGTWRFNPPCLDACDANDDGRVDLADSVSILRYLFKFDDAPKAPFPEAGPDPSADKLSCVGGGSCP